MWELSQNEMDKSSETQKDINSSLNNFVQSMFLILGIQLSNTGVAYFPCNTLYKYNILFNAILFCRYVKDLVTLQKL